jgi:hypothetical protein
LLPAVAGFIVVLLTGLIARELGGGTYAQVLSCLTLTGSLLFLRAYSMLQPVPFDILFWTASLYFLLRYINSRKNLWLIILGICFGLGLLNKYMVIFLAAGIFVALLLTSYRKTLGQKTIWIAVAIALLLFLPNLIWQYTHGFPVIRHMEELRETQLVNVKRINIVIDQLLMLTFGAIIWLAGLIWLTFNRSAKPFRIFAIIYFTVLAIFLVLKGKSYYMAGFYPFLFAAGGVAWERTLHSSGWRISVAAIVFLLGLPLVPAGIPIVPAEKLASYFGNISPKMGGEALLRWEDGKMHPLPQDFADMLGWDELGNIIVKASDTIEDKRRIMIYGENYGQAGAVDHYGQTHNLPPAISFSDSYLMWMPDSVSSNVNMFFYINGERGDDIFPMFERVDSIGCITNPLAREYGTSVFLCRNPGPEFREFFKKKVREVKNY